MKKKNGIKKKKKKFHTLRNDLSKDDNADSTANNGPQPAREVVYQDREGGVDQHVAEE